MYMYGIKPPPVFPVLKSMFAFSWKTPPDDVTGENILNLLLTTLRFGLNVLRRFVQLGQNVFLLKCN